MYSTAHVYNVRAEEKVKFTDFHLFIFSASEMKINFILLFAMGKFPYLFGAIWYLNWRREERSCSWILLQCIHINCTVVYSVCAEAVAYYWRALASNWGKSKSKSSAQNNESTDDENEDASMYDSHVHLIENKNQFTDTRLLQRNRKDGIGTQMLMANH